MTEFRKTLQQGTPIISPFGAPAQPGAPAGVAVSVVPSSVPQKPRVPSSVPQRPVVPGSLAPVSSLEEVRAGDAGPVWSGAPLVPPPPGRDELRQSRPPQGHRTPRATRQAPAFGPPLPENAPGWMLRARRMSLALEEAIAAGQPVPGLEASIERAWAAWELDGTTDRDIARLARLLDKAHRAIRDAPAATLDAAYNDVAQVLWAGLPRAVKARRELPDALQVVRGLRGDADAWAAVVEAVARLLGWDTTGRAHAAQAVRVAVMSNRNE